jgi:hypothetical protein
MREHAVYGLDDDDRDVQRDGDCEGAAVAFDGGMGVVTMARVAVSVMVIRVAGFGGAAWFVLTAVVTAQAVAAVLVFAVLVLMPLMRWMPFMHALLRSVRFIDPVRPIGFLHHVSWE